MAEMTAWTQPTRWPSWRRGEGWTWLLINLGKPPREDPDDPPVFQGGQQAMHLSECNYVTLAHFIVDGCRINGLNCDDGGSIDTPMHHLFIENVTITRSGTTATVSHTAHGMASNDKILLRGITDKTRLIVLNSPQNPTGGMLDAKDLEDIAEIGRQRVQMTDLRVGDRQSLAAGVQHTGPNRAERGSPSQDEDLRVRVQPLDLALGHEAEPAVQLQGLVDQITQCQLVHALGGGVDSREPIFGGQRFILVKSLVLGMHHLQHHRPPADFAENAHTRAAHEALLLGFAEMEKSQHQGSGAVAESDQQAAAPPKLDLREIDFGFNDRGGAGAQAPYRDNTGAILVATRQMKQNILDCLNSERCQPDGGLRSDATQCGDRQSIKSAFDDAQTTYGFNTRTASISTLAPLGSAPTPTTARAG